MLIGEDMQFQVVKQINPFAKCKFKHKVEKPNLKANDKIVLFDKKKKETIEFRIISVTYHTKMHLRAKRINHTGKCVLQALTK
jgi:hypothetical protein